MDEKQTTADLIVDYVKRAPVRIVNVASHFGMALRDAHLALVELEEAGRIEPFGRDQWRISR